LRKVHIISLGCPKNLVDSEYMAGILSRDNFQLTDKPEKADIVIINTCGFIQDAVKESIDVILDMARLKKNGDLKKLIVVGCFVQRYGYKLKREIPEVDLWAGTGTFHMISQLLKNERDFFISRPTYVQKELIPRLQSTPFYTAYLKISDGCSHNCSYCLIPKLRGRIRSIPIDLLIKEAKYLVEQGVKEINIIAQDTTSYGKDIGDEVRLESLIEALCKIKGIEWIRLLYLYPSGISDQLLRMFEQEEKLCPYLDIPLQHINDKILRSMNRDYKKKDILVLLEKIRSIERKIFLRTTLMVGFPGETEKIFQELCDFIKNVEFDHLGVFVFSTELGVKATRLKPQIKKEVAEERRDVIMSIQADISEKKNKEMIGKTIPVLIEGTHPETEVLLVGRSSWMAPEIDGQVIINKGYGIVGEIMPVRITDAHVYDLIGEIL